MHITLLETLKILGGKEEIDKSIKFIKPNLVIKHSDAGIKYTVKKIVFDEETKSPSVICYRYYGPNGKKKILIKIDKENFSKYEPV
tara:strand:- start:425 stop:682 length:258 start_codon:yes stop_codon:yes gene_type:complete